MFPANDVGIIVVREKHELGVNALFVVYGVRAFLPCMSFRALVMNVLGCVGVDACVRARQGMDDSSNTAMMVRMLGEDILGILNIQRLIRIQCIICMIRIYIYHSERQQHGRHQ